METCAGIITYNPELDQLKLNIESIINQVNFVVIVDNGSENYEEIKNEIDSIQNVMLLSNSVNCGIAKALNQIMTYASIQNVEWVLTLDQDTVSPDNVISEYVKYVDKGKVGLLTSQIRDVNIDRLITEYVTDKITVVDRCITSGAFTNVEAWKKIQGFDEAMFIDYVDFDFSIRLIMQDYLIIRVNEVCFEHSLGNCTMRRLFFSKVRVSNHSANRKYYISRNIIYYIRKHGRKINTKKEYLRLAKVILFTILYEDNKLKKIKAINRGIRDGCKMSY